MRAALALALLALSLVAVVAPATSAHLPCPIEDCPTIVPVPDDPVVTGSVEFSSFRAQVDIADGLADTRLWIVVRNILPAPSEVELSIPIPDAAALWAFNLTVDGRVLEGRVQEKQQAAQTYQSAVEHGVDAVLLEQAADRQLRLRLNVPPGSERVLQVAYVEPVGFASGERFHRLPTATLSKSLPLQFEVDVHIEGRDVLHPRFPTMALDIVTLADSEIRAHAFRFLPTAIPDVVTIWGDKDHWTGDLAISELGPDAKAMASLCLGGARPLDHDVLFVLDHSGSMSGAKMLQARLALSQAIAQLHEGDRYDVVIFDDQVNLFHGRLIEATSENLRADSLHALDISADGGTDIDAGLQEALATLGAASDRPAMVVFLTDGMPTSGIVDHDQIIERFRTNNLRPAAIHVVPIGLDADHTFLADLALRSGGLYAPMEGGDPLLGSRITRLTQIVGGLTADQLKLSISGVEAGLVLPRVLPDISQDGCLTVVFDVAATTGDTIVIEIQAEGADGDIRRSFAFPVSEAAVRPSVGALWARAVIDDMLSQERIEKLDMHSEIVATAVALRALSPYTSWVISAEQAPESDQPPGDGCADCKMMFYEDAAMDRASYGSASASAPMPTMSHLMVSATAPPTAATKTMGEHDDQDRILYPVPESKPTPMAPLVSMLAALLVIVVLRRRW